MSVIITIARNVVAAGFSLRKQSHNSKGVALGLKSIAMIVWIVFLLLSVVPWHSASQAVEQQPLAIKPFIYEGAKYRDPFLSPFDSGGVKSRGRFLLSGLHLKGILRTSRGLDYAIIVSETGNRYILVGQRLYDDYDKVIPRVQGYVRGDTVILKSGNQIKELFTEEKK
jgi:hypothetical protein